MSLQGNLADLPLIDLVQLLTMQNKTGILSVSRNFSQAQICFSSSRIYSAFVHYTTRNRQQAHLEGEEALYNLLSWPEGQFCFELVSALPRAQNLDINWNHTVLEYCRRQDERERQNRLLQLASIRPRLVPNPPVRAEITLTLEDWQILLQVNGQASLQDIAANIRQPLEQIVKIAEKLKKQGLIELDSFIPAEIPAALGYTAPWQAGKSSYDKNAAITWAERDSHGSVRQLPAPEASRYVVSTSTPRPASAEADKPKVQRGILSGLMAKIRGL